MTISPTVRHLSMKKSSHPAGNELPALRTAPFDMLRTARAELQTRAQSNPKK